MDYPETHTAATPRYLGSDRPIENEQTEPAEAVVETVGAEQPAARAVFEHENKMFGILGAFLSLALVTAWQFFRLPLGTAGMGLAMMAVSAAGFIAFRLWLCTQRVTIDAGGFELRMGNRTERVEFNEIRGFRFDRVSHDLLVDTTKHTIRLARSLQGHRVIRQRLMGAVPHAAAPETFIVKPRMLPRFAGTIALCVMVTCVAAIMSVNTSLGVLNLLGLLLPSYVLFNRCICRSYRMTSDGIEVRGLRGSRFHARGELLRAQIHKGALFSTLKLEFADETVELDEYLLGQSLVEVSEYIETNWNIPVRPGAHSSGAGTSAATELT